MWQQRGPVDGLFARPSNTMCSLLLIKAQMAATRDRDELFGTFSNTTKEERTDFARSAYGGNAGPATDALAFI